LQRAQIQSGLGKKIADNKKAARGRLFHEPVGTDYLEAALAAAEAASAADEAAAAAPEAAASAAEAAGAGAATGAGAGGVTVVSSFLLHAARATEATRDANRSDFFILVLKAKGRTITGNCGTPPIPQSPNAQKTTRARASQWSSRPLYAEDCHSPRTEAGKLSTERCETASNSSRFLIMSPFSCDTPPR